MNGQGLEGTAPTRPPGRYRIADMGRYIALEGIEGAGKTSVQAGLRLRLEAAGREVVCVREPGGTPVGRSLRRILLDGLEPIPWAEALLFAADRAQLAAEVIRPALDRGAWVLSDRSVYSSLAYQGVGRGLGMDRIRALNELGLAGTWPDLVILLAVTPAVGLARQDMPHQMSLLPGAGSVPRPGPAREDRTDRIGSEGERFQSVVLEAFEELVRRQPERFAVIDAERPLEEVMEDVWAAVEGGS